jgi:hypothetical protein
MKRFLSAYNKINPGILAFLFPSLFYLGFSLIYNEEQYFGYAKAFMDSTWMKDSFVFSDFPGTRVFFQWIFGYLLHFLSFEQMAFFGRFLTFLLLAFPVAALSKFFKLNNILLSFWLVILFLPQQNFFGGEWIYGGFESKTISYVFVMWSLVFLFREKYFSSILFAGLSIYWHMLVGGWFSIYLFIFLFFRMIKSPKIFLYWCIFGIMQLPFLYYIYKGLIAGSEGVINGVNISFVYTYIRNPHHIGLFKSMDYFLSYHAGKVGLAAVALAITTFIYRKILPEYLKPVNTLLIIILCQNLFFVIIAYLDKNGVLMKTYPFRGSTLAMLLFQLETIVLVRHKLIPYILKMQIWKRKSFDSIKVYRYQMIGILSIVLVVSALKANERIRKYNANLMNWKYTDILSADLKANSSPEETYLLLCPENEYMLSLPRKSERDSYYYSRYIPTSNQGIYEWYNRGLIHDKLLLDPANIKYPECAINPHLLVACVELNYPFLKLISTNGPYYLYKIE